VRAFVAVPIAPGRLEGLPAPLEEHLTLRFFAELAEGQVDTVAGALEEAASGFAPFSLELRGLGAFPTAERPRVLWVGVGEGEVPLRELHARVDRALSARGLPGESRPFAPHVTLFRVRSPASRARASELLGAGAGRSFGRVPIGELRLYSSLLTPAGAEHRRLRRAPLTGPPDPPP
jgi:RNA 2',3'-cyclic 3'-phosphodiesterase